VLALSLELAQNQPGSQPLPLPHSVGVPVGLIVLLGFLVDGIWRLVQYVGVIAHEGAHVVAGWSTGRKVSGVRLNRNATGATRTSGPERGSSRVITAFAGYAGPSLFGLGAAGLIALGHVEAVLWLALIFLAVLLVFVRNFFGLISLLFSGALVFLVLHYGSAEFHVVAAEAISWFLLFFGVRAVFTLGSNAVDAETLSGLTHVPTFVWATLWFVIAVAALWVGGRLLI
jgi:Peptidase M50B-like